MIFFGNFLSYLDWIKLSVYINQCLFHKSSFRLKSLDVTEILHTISSTFPSDLGKTHFRISKALGHHMFNDRISRTVSSESMLHYEFSYTMFDVLGYLLQGMLSMNWRLLGFFCFLFYFYPFKFTSPTQLNKQEKRLFLIFKQLRYWWKVQEKIISSFVYFTLKRLDSAFILYFRIIAKNTKTKMKKKNRILK